MTFEEQEQRFGIFTRDNFTCICKNDISEYGTPQIGHIIPQSKEYLGKYGKAIIQHPKNKKSCCSLKCNGKVSINGKHLLIEKLVKKIKLCL